MDTGFWVYNPVCKTEVYLLDELEAAKEEKVFKCVHTLTTKMVGHWTGNYLPVCNFDCENLSWSGKFVIVYIMLVLC